MAAPLPQLKNIVKRQIRRYKQWRHAFGPDELAEALRDVGVRSGSTLMLHSSFDRFIGFTGQMSDVVKVLRDAVGERGNLMVPTIPFSGTAVDYARRNPVFDVRRTPSQMGIIAEMIRRFPGAVRSVHPTHSVAIVGPNAEQLARDHHRADTPCGRETPYGRLLDVDGEILFLGADIAAMTFFHTIECVLEEQMPFSPFTKERFGLSSIDTNGDTVRTSTRLFDPSVSRRRDIAKLRPVLERHGAWHDRRVGVLPISLVGAQDALRAAQELSERSEFCYER